MPHKCGSRRRGGLEGGGGHRQSGVVKVPAVLVDTMKKRKKKGAKKDPAVSIHGCDLPYQCLHILQVALQLSVSIIKIKDRS